MAVHVIECEYCGKRLAVRGKDAQAIINQIDASGWDHTELDYGLCPDCQDRIASEMLYLEQD